MSNRPNFIAVDHELELAFFGVAKCGHTAVKRALLLSRGVDDENVHNWKHFDYVTPEAWISTTGKARDYPSFTFVRHPLGRLASCYLDKVVWRTSRGDPFRPFGQFGIAPDCSFERFVAIVSEVPDEEADEHFQSMSARLYDDATGFVLPREILRHETMAIDWERVRSFAARELVPLTQYPPPKDYGRTAASLYAGRDDLRESVLRRYWRDVELFYPRDP